MSGRPQGGREGYTVRRGDGIFASVVLPPKYTQSPPHHSKCKTSVQSPHLLDGHGEVENLGVLEVLQSVVLDDCHAHVRVAERLDAVTDPHDKLVLLTHALNILSSIGTLVCPLKRTSKHIRTPSFPLAH